MVMVCAVPPQKTHSIAFEPRHLCYPWHPWYGLSVLTRKAGGARADGAYFCKLPESPLHAMLVEIPRWMFDAAECAAMQLVERPYVDCATLRTLEKSISEQRVSMKAAVLQPQLSRQAGQGDTDGSDSTNKPNETTGAVQRTTRCTALERSNRVHAGRGGRTSGATARQCSTEFSSSRPSRPGRAR